jgi:hypothetical protein
MGQDDVVGWRWLAAAVMFHLAVTLVHGAAHAGAGVPLSRSANLFVIVVILLAPLAGLAVALIAARLGASIVAVAMGSSLVFGVVNHFVRSGPDHVSAVDASWHTLFATSAVLLVITEAVGLGIASRIALQRKRLS